MRGATSCFLYLPSWKTTRLDGHLFLWPRLCLTENTVSAIMIRRITERGIHAKCRSQWPRGLKRRSAAARLLKLWVRIPPGAWMSVVSVVCCHVEVSATHWSLIQRSPTDCVVCRRVWSRNPMNEEAVDRVGPQRHRGAGGGRVSVNESDFKRNRNNAAVFSGYPRIGSSRKPVLWVSSC